MVGPTTPLVVAYCRPPTPIAVVYFTESAKNASSAVIRFRRSDFIEARYAFSRIRELRNRDRGQNADDHDHDQKLDQGKPFRFVTARPPSGDTDTGRGFRTRREAF